MNPAYTELSLGAQTAYAQLLEAILMADHHRTVADLKGSFAAKTVKGKGVSFAENEPLWHHKSNLPDDQIAAIYAALEEGL